MATALDESLAVFTECAICLETLKDPRMLPCGHSMCLACAEGLEVSKQLFFPPDNSRDRLNLE